MRRPTPRTLLLCRQQANSSKLPRVGWRGNMFGVNPRLSEWLRRVSQVLCKTDGREGGETSSTGLREGWWREWWWRWCRTALWHTNIRRWMEENKNKYMTGTKWVKTGKIKYIVINDTKIEGIITMCDRHICGQWRGNEYNTFVRSATPYMFKSERGESQGQAGERWVKGGRRERKQHIFSPDFTLAC